VPPLTSRLPHLTIDDAEGMRMCTQHLRVFIKKSPAHSGLPEAKPAHLRAVKLDSGIRNAHLA